MTLYLYKKQLILLGSLLAVSACGGGATGETDTGGNTSTTYLSLGNTTADATSNLIAVGLQSSSSNGEFATVSGSGTLTHNTGELIISDGQTVLTDSDGPIAGTYSGSNGATLSQSAALETSGYEYLSIGNLNYEVNGGTFDTVVIYGVETAPSDMPTGGGATYTGQGSATLITDANSYALQNGSSEITVSFLNNNVDVELTDFTVIDGVTGAGTTAPIDEIRIDGMGIDANLFSGGNLYLLSNGNVVLVTGANTASDAQGVFFGIDGVQPDEVGGVFVSTGDDAILTGQFIGD